MRPVNAACGSFYVTQKNIFIDLTQLSTLSVMQYGALSTATEYLTKYRKLVFIFRPSSVKMAVDSSTLLLFVSWCLACFPFYLQVLDKLDMEVLDSWIFHHWLYLTGIRIGVSKMQEFLYVHISLGPLFSLSSYHIFLQKNLHLVL